MAQLLCSPDPHCHVTRTPNVGRRSYAPEGAPPRILMHALRDVEVGDELQWNYGDGYWAAHDGLVADA